VALFWLQMSPVNPVLHMHTVMLAELNVQLPLPQQGDVAVMLHAPTAVKNLLSGVVQVVCIPAFRLFEMADEI
jgi:hypothetical protein